MADAAAGLIRALGFEKANVLAYSMGARIGQQLLIRHPDLDAESDFLVIRFAVAVEM